ncbi:transcriptional regulator [Prevotella bivia DNF00650]|nr:WYL domain-containing protein [Prevotella bivia]KGF38019.1 transcriptional regulator [Prevotella bivia DNF00650]MDU3909543.1 WYL domain-containing protein [Prevotella bivia]
MAANNLGRYVWLLDTIRRHKRLTFEEINRLWVCSGLSYGEGDEIPLRTFHNHRKAISDIFDVYIECDNKDGYRYYIDAPEKLKSDSLRSWLIDSYSMLNQVQADKKLEGRILFEDIPSGHEWLTNIMQAMREEKVLYITYQGFGKPIENSFEIEPYYLKVINRRWYVLARSPYYSERNQRQNKEDGDNRPADDYRLYALDRVLDMALTDNHFKMKKSFDIEEYFEGCYGIIANKNIPIERIVLKAWKPHCCYLESLPLHHSQRIIAQDDESITFELKVRPTFDFYQALLAQTDVAEVLEPESVRQEMKRFTENMLYHYKK